MQIQLPEGGQIAKLISLETMYKIVFQMENFQLGKSIEGLIADSTNHAIVEEQRCDPLATDKGLTF